MFLSVYSIFIRFPIVVLYMSKCMCLFLLSLIYKLNKVDFKSDLSYTDSIKSNLKEVCIMLSIQLEDCDLTLGELCIEGGEFSAVVMLDNIAIGGLQGYGCLECIHLEYISLDTPYQHKGYGQLALKELMKQAKAVGVGYVDGECRCGLISFYMRLGADFEPRTAEDLTYMNHRFYIDL